MDRASCPAKGRVPDHGREVAVLWPSIAQGVARHHPSDHSLGQLHQLVPVHPGPGRPEHQGAPGHVDGHRVAIEPTDRAGGPGGVGAGRHQPVGHGQEEHPAAARRIADGGGGPDEGVRSDGVEGPTDQELGDGVRRVVHPVAVAVIGPEQCLVEHAQRPRALDGPVHRSPPRAPTGCPRGRCGRDRPGPGGGSGSA